MTVYNINLGIGWASSGVEYAQSYRAKVLKKLGIPAKFIFVDMFTQENIEHFTKNIDFDDDQVIWFYQYFTDIKNRPTTFTPADLEKSFASQSYAKKVEDKKIRYNFPNDTFYTAYLAGENDQYVHRVEIVSRGFLIRKDYYNYTKMFSEHYAPKDGKAVAYSRIYYNEDGSVAYEEMIGEKDSVFFVDNQFFDSKEEFFGYFLRCLPKEKNDVILVDRTTGIGKACLQNKGEAQLGVVVHAEHFSENATNEQEILWNNYYEYTFTNTKYVDFFIASTQAQADILTDQFKQYYNKDVKVVPIPVGSLKELKENDARKKHSLITASRLALEKHVDLIVEAVVQAKKEVPDLSFDIYGKGGEEGKLQGLIAKYEAQDYIRLMGHQKLDEIFKEYEGYVSASGSEGFGLTLLEAVGSGLPMIGFDVRYGNPTFIDPEKNGVLMPSTTEDSDALKIERLKDAIVHMCNDVNWTDWSNRSYEIAADYLDEAVCAKWDALVGGAR